MTDREHLLNRRSSATFSFEVAGLHYIASDLALADGFGEMFLTNHKTNSDRYKCTRRSDHVLDSLQHGADAETIRRALYRDGRVRADRSAPHSTSSPVPGDEPWIAAG